MFHLIANIEKMKPTNWSVKLRRCEQKVHVVVQNNAKLKFQTSNIIKQ